MDDVSSRAMIDLGVKDVDHSLPESLVGSPKLAGQHAIPISMDGYVSHFAPLAHEGSSEGCANTDDTSAPEKSRRMTLGRQEWLIRR